jgi:hypothetical protein
LCFGTTLSFGGGGVRPPAVPVTGFFFLAFGFGGGGVLPAAIQGDVIVSRNDVWCMLSPSQFGRYGPG